MPSQRLLRATILHLVLLSIARGGSNELRTATATIFLWALGLALHRRFSLSPAFLRLHYLFVLVSCVLLAATNDLFYENTAGRLFDVWFERPSYDPDTPGAGFTMWRMTFCRQNRHELALVWALLRIVVIWGLVFVAAPFVVVTLCAFRKMMEGYGELTDAMEALDEHHREHPPWLGQ
jgi:hypothetical protein